MKLYKLSTRAYQYYRDNVKGNEQLNFNEARNKLSRNIELSIEAPVESGRVIYLYGNLHIHVKGDVIVYIKNHWTSNDWFYKNPQKLRELNLKYGIENSISVWNEVGNTSYVDEYAKGFLN